MNNSQSGSHRITTVLFDLDGTLADTAPDLAFALNTVLAEEGRATLSLDRIRPHVSQGATALLRFGFAIEPQQQHFAVLLQRFLQVYQANLARQTRLFPGMAELLDRLEQNHLRWGVVTNKPAYLTDPLMRALQLDRRAACIVSGDTTPESKPHPAPMLHACALAGCTAPQCLYVGDAQRDIEAGRRAGMKTMVALFGYINDGERPETWQADAMAHQPLEIFNWLQRCGPAAVCIL